MVDGLNLHSNIVVGTTSEWMSALQRERKKKKERARISEMGGEEN